MSKANNNWKGLGRWAKEIELKTMANEKQTKYFRNTLVVGNGKNQDGEELPPDYINITAYGKVAETLAKWTKKGSRVYVSGEIKTGSYDDQNGEKVYTWGVKIEDFEIVDFNSDNQNANQNAQSAPAQSNASQNQNNTQPANNSAPNDNFMSVEGIEGELPSGWGV